MPGIHPSIPGIQVMPGKQGRPPNLWPPSYELFRTAEEKKISLIMPPKCSYDAQLNLVGSQIFSFFRFRFVPDLFEIAYLVKQMPKVAASEAPS